MSEFPKVLIDKGYPGLRRQELISYEIHDGTVTKKTTTRIFDETGRYYDSNNIFTFCEGGTAWNNSLQNTMLIKKSQTELKE